MSENENASDGVSDGTGNGGAGTTWGWEPVPHGGEYDSDATAFVQLPPDMLGEAGIGEPLAAPGHGFVPPPMIVPLGSAGTDPAATGTWTLPVRWPEAGGSAPAEPVARVQAAPAPVLGPIPAVIPMPASAMAGLHGDADQGPEGGPDAGAGSGAGVAPGYEHAYEYGYAHGQDHGHDSGHDAGLDSGHDSGLDSGTTTAEWRFPEAGDTGQFDLGAHTGQAGQTGQWAIPVVDGELPEESGEFRHGGLEADWSQAPATLPGGAAAPWATQPDLGFSGAETFAETYAETFADPVGEPVAERAVEPFAEPDALAQAVPGPGADPRDSLGGGFDAFGALDPEQTMNTGALPASAPAPAPPSASGFGAGRRVMGGPGVGTATPLPRGPRVLGGPGVGTPLPDHLQHVQHVQHVEDFDHLAHGEGPVHPAAPDIDAAHGAAAAPVTAERPHPAAEVHGAEQVHGPEQGHASEHGQGPEHGHGPVSGFAGAGGAPGGAEGERRETGTAPGGGDPAEVPDAQATYEEEAAGPAEAPVADQAPDPVAVEAAAQLPDQVLAEVPAQVPVEVSDQVPAQVPAHEEHPLASYVLRVNGADRPVTGAWIGESLLYVLRERLGLAGAKDGCSQGECGACAVQVDGRLVASCLVPAATAASSEVRTVEGLATDGELSDVQQALCRSGAVQCGFCVPGMAMTIHDLLEGNHAPSELETRQALCGNLCRCSGYRGVIEAVGEVVAEREAAAEAAAGGSPGAPIGSPGGAEPRIPHQAAPGEGGIHPDHQHGGMA